MYIMIWFFNVFFRRHNNGKRCSGGVTVFVRKTLASTNHIKRIYNEWKDCVSLLVDRRLTGLRSDIFT